MFRKTKKLAEASFKAHTLWSPKTIWINYVFWTYGVIPDGSQESIIILEHKAGFVNVKIELINVNSFTAKISRKDMCIKRKRKELYDEKSIWRLLFRFGYGD